VGLAELAALAVVLTLPVGAGLPVAVIVTEEEPVVLRVTRAEGPPLTVVVPGADGFSPLLALELTVVVFDDCIVRVDVGLAVFDVVPRSDPVSVKLTSTVFVTFPVFVLVRRLVGVFVEEDDFVVVLVGTSPVPVASTLAYDVFVSRALRVADTLPEEVLDDGNVRVPEGLPVDVLVLVTLGVSVPDTRDVLLTLDEPVIVEDPVDDLDEEAERDMLAELVELLVPVTDFVVVPELDDVRLVDADFVVVGVTPVVPVIGSVATAVFVFTLLSLL
jgi:hypothetical protein